MHQRRGVYDTIRLHDKKCYLLCVWSIFVSLRSIVFIGSTPTNPPQGLPVRCVHVVGFVGILIVCSPHPLFLFLFSSYSGRRNQEDRRGKGCSITPWVLRYQLRISYARTPSVVSFPLCLSTPRLTGIIQAGEREFWKNRLRVFCMKSENLWQFRSFLLLVCTTCLLWWPCVATRSSEQPFFICNRKPRRWT